MAIFFDKKGEPINLEEWIRLRGDINYRLVRRTDLGNYHVTTMWLGTDQGNLDDDPPLIYGTMVYQRDTKEYLDAREMFAATEEGALENHAFLVKQYDTKRVK